MFKRYFKSLFNPFQHKKTVSEELKTWYFPSAFWLTGQWGVAIAPLATLLLVYVVEPDKTIITWVAMANEKYFGVSSFSDPPAPGLSRMTL